MGRAVLGLVFHLKPERLQTPSFSLCLCLVGKREMRPIWRRTEKARVTEALLSLR